MLNGEGKNKEAEELLRTVIEQEPKYGQAYYSLGLLLAEMEQLEEATRFFEGAAALLPEQSRIFYNLAIAHQTLGNPDRSEAAYKKAIDLEPGYGDYRYGLTTLYLQEGQNQMALEQVQQLSKIYPNNPQFEQLLQLVQSRL